MVTAGRDMAAAVQGHVKALRSLGRDHTSICAIADALHMTDSEVEAVFHDFKIVGAKPDERKKVLHTRFGQTWSQIIALKK